MKYFLLLIVTSLLSHTANAQSNNFTHSGFGFVLNSGINSEVNAILIVPSASFYNGKSQFELGVGFESFIQKDQRTISGQFNYKYFPNGRENKFNMYLMMSFAYINQLKKTHYPAIYQYLFLNGGYGFQIRTFKRLYIGTNINIGTFTNNKRSKNPYKDYYGNEYLFDEFGVSLACAINMEYRF